ncbi:transcriptional regulator GutM [Microvirga guangxiensis]|uniref:Glucitol operon activator protein n=1 Tax=Microvirga guangxiensis TaxID=549386 RepID=A0A1G5E4D7_9HYPH|nr:transcriptional regulator GutM [Microvirga guangxiensis]SCY21822.1 glucitol operon activator protein [Microvirga guangxiensis]
MALWQIGLLLLAAVWLLQAVGTWLQMRHYREVMGTIHSRWTDGYMGVGNARASLGRGVILILVVAPDDTIRDLFVMEGRSVFAKFKRLDQFEGRDVVSLLADEAFIGMRGRKQALEQALQQIENAKARKSEAAAALRDQPA